MEQSASDVSDLWLLKWVNLSPEPKKMHAIGMRTALKNPKNATKRNVGSWLPGIPEPKNLGADWNPGRGRIPKYSIQIHSILKAKYNIQPDICPKVCQTSNTYIYSINKCRSPILIYSNYSWDCPTCLSSCKQSNAFMLPYPLGRIN